MRLKELDSVNTKHKIVHAEEGEKSSTIMQLLGHPITQVVVSPWTKAKRLKPSFNLKENRIDSCENAKWTANNVGKRSTAQIGCKEDKIDWLL